MLWNCAKKAKLNTKKMPFSLQESVVEFDLSSCIKKFTFIGLKQLFELRS